MNMTDPRMLFLYSDTGGGHRSAAEAVLESLRSASGGRVAVEMVDFLKDFAPRPFSDLPDLYPVIMRRPGAYGLMYRLSNGPRAVRSLRRLTWPFVRRAAGEIIRAHPADLIVSFHPLANDAALRARSEYLADGRPQYVTVVTDLVSTHALWFHKKSDLVIVPTRKAYEHALACGIEHSRLVEVGLPVAERFLKPDPDRATARADLGWPADRQIILLMGGGDGMGPLEETAAAIDGAGLPADLAIVTGRNAELKRRLEARRWKIPTHIYGFVKEMPALMRGADVLVTKAGPGTICEALTAGLPVVLYSYLPGQEVGNVPYLTEPGAGVWAPTPGEVVAALRRWEEDPEGYRAARRAAQELARPDAARRIAQLLLERVGETTSVQGF